MLRAAADCRLQHGQRRRLWEGQRVDLEGGDGCCAVGGGVAALLRGGSCGGDGGLVPRAGRLRVEDVQDGERHLLAAHAEVLAQALLGLDAGQAEAGSSRGMGRLGRPPSLGCQSMAGLSLLSGQEVRPMSRQDSAVLLGGSAGVKVSMVEKMDGGTVALPAIMRWWAQA